jgi:hypothetical protein
MKGQVRTEEFRLDSLESMPVLLKILMRKKVSLEWSPLAVTPDSWVRTPWGNLLALSGPNVGVARGLGMDADVTGASELCQPSSAGYSAVWCRRASEDGHVRMAGVRKSSDEVIVSIIHYDVDFEDIDRAG